MNEFTLECIKDIPGLHTTIVISGYLSQIDNFASEWQGVTDWLNQGRTYALRWEAGYFDSIDTEMSID